MPTNSLIHGFTIPVGDDGKPVIPGGWSEADMRGYFTVAGSELDEIRAIEAGTRTTDVSNRMVALIAFQKALRENVTALVDAARADREAVAAGGLPTLEAAGIPVPEEVVPGTHPTTQPLNPPQTHPASTEGDEGDPKPKKAKAEAEEPELIAAGLGTLIKDSAGNEYRLVRNTSEGQAATLGAGDLGAAAQAVRGTNSPLIVGERGAEPGITTVPAPMLAAIPGQTLSGGNVDGHGNVLTAADVGQQLHRFGQSAKTLAGSAQKYLFRRDRFAGLEGVERIPTSDTVSAPAAQMMMDSQRAHTKAILAAFCGPAELDRSLDLTAPSTARPVAAAMGQTTAIGMGVHEFFREMGLADLLAHYTANSSAPTGVGIWTTGDQATVNPEDPDTWKPYFTLPGCPATIKVAAYFLYQALRVNIEDQMSRPQYIDNITVLMEVMLARLAEQALLETIDGWSFQRTIAASPTGYGASRQLFYAMRQVLTWATTATRNTDPGRYTLIVPDTLAAVAEIDGVMSGEGPGFWQDMLRQAGVDVLITPDWGLEGNPMAPLPIQPNPDNPDSGNGGAVPALPSTFTVRLAPMGDFVHGVVGIEDYGVNTSPDLKRQNAVEYFGETAEIAYKRGGFPSFTLTLAGIIGNGAKPDAVAPFTYGSPVAYANNMPSAAPKIGSGFVAGQQL